MTARGKVQYLTTDDFGGLWAINFLIFYHPLSLMPDRAIITIYNETYVFISVDE